MAQSYLRYKIAALGISITTALAAAMLTAAPARAAVPDPTGWWLDESGRAGLLISACGDAFCGKIEWLKAPLKADGTPKVDDKNGDPALKGRPLCGLPMIGGFTSDGPNSWGGGWIYNPEDGDTYKSNMALNPDGTLHVRGYVGIPLFGKSQTWTRPTETLTPCDK